MPEPEDFDRAINDPSEWGPPKKGRKSEKRQRSAVVSVRMTEAELATVQAKAQAAGHTIGAYMRDLAVHGASAQPNQPVIASRGATVYAFGSSTIIKQQVTEAWIPQRGQPAAL